MKINLISMLSEAAKLGALEGVKSDVHAESIALRLISSAKVEDDPKSFLDKLIRSVSIDTGIPVRDIKGAKRQQPIVDARWEVFKRAHQEGMSHSEIARVMNKDHTTVMHALREMEFIQ